MNREEALRLLKSHVSNKNLLKHMYACECIMGALAIRFNQDEHSWRLAGLLHDIDYDALGDNMDQHGIIGVEILKEAGITEDIIQAVQCHVERLGYERRSLLDKALFCTDPTSGFIVAGGLI